MNEVEELPWDSNFFGYKVGRLIGAYPTFPDFSNFRLVYVYSDVLIDDLKEHLIDKKVVFSYQLSNSDKYTEYSSDTLIQPFDILVHSYDELLNLTFESGVYSRFFKDRNFRDNEFEKLYKIWIDNSLKKINALDVFVAIKENSLMGFITLEQRTSKLCAIGLVAVSSASRGKKVATSLIQYAKQVALKLDFEQMIVTTQLDNMPAINLYKSNGFQLKEVKYIYHIWNYDTL